MHLGNGIICPVTGIPMLAAAGIAAFYAYKNTKKNFSKDKIIPIVTLTAFVFALQMINFAIPLTGSSGHIIGGILLSAVLGPYAAFLAICAILTIQAVLFADGGLTALGCNIFNMGILSCFVAYPFLYKPFAEKNKYFLGSLTASVAALQFGAIAVVMESALSGSISFADVASFAALMQFIHFPIGITEGCFTGGIIIALKNMSNKNMLKIFGTVSLILVVFISKIASQMPDGLEWSLLKMSDSFILQTHSTFYNIAEFIQTKTAIFEHPSALTNAAGVVAVAFLMYFVCLSLNKKELIKINIDTEK